MPSKQETEQQKAVKDVFHRLPKVFRTDGVKAEIANSVARAAEGNYEEAALVSVMVCSPASTEP